MNQDKAMPGFGGLAGSLGSVGASTAKPDLFDQLRQAQIDWFAACKDYSGAAERRAQCQCHLEQLTKATQAMIVDALNDPTQPQPEPPMPTQLRQEQARPGNARY